MTNDYINEFTPDWPHGHVVVLSACIGCRFAEWERTANGKLHPNKSGRCTWRAKTEPTPWWIVGDRVIFRADVLPDARRATCDAREDV